MIFEKLPRARSSAVYVRTMESGNYIRHEKNKKRKCFLEKRLFTALIYIESKGTASLGIPVKM
jgi:hypothetical protein